MNAATKASKVSLGLRYLVAGLLAVAVTLAFGPPARAAHKGGGNHSDHSHSGNNHHNKGKKGSTKQKGQNSKNGQAKGGKNSGQGKETPLQKDEKAFGKDVGNVLVDQNKLAADKAKGVDPSQIQADKDQLGVDSAKATQDFNKLNQDAKK